MSISIGTSTTSSAWETHAAWLRLRADYQPLVDLAAAERQGPDGGGRGRPDVARDTVVEMPSAAPAEH
ncbi:hypothetical protein [Actinoplanes regularis]|uniref:Uncharacterized protein n=1 Tax=Actinoplanes regularis TaxID=52697 RepID=A0A238ZM07_9ACTN|nr:hypothetical protein [Actinoplanes regularis]GIE87580.1 hypothetical protein Are01nite_40600 [Actinoplanes regularis]GLW31652.1 hypothetical protein Areg01_45920 [Actinoplanes regularis]SNR84486.1 hypothetical protein SAMN06264365_106148 [Actinoplanes regularis]